MTSSPTLFFRASTGLVSSACTVLPACNWLALAACACLFFSETVVACDAVAEVFDSARAPDWPAETDVSCDADPLAWDCALCAIQIPADNTPANSETRILFIE